MKVIHERNPIAAKILRDQSLPLTTPLRPILFSLTTAVAEGTLVYNILTKELLLLEGDEARAMQPPYDSPAETVRYLTAHRFLVPQEHDDHKLSCELRSIVRLLDKRKPKNGLDRFTILTTTDCNARCFYCFEHGGLKMTMDDSMAENVAEYVLKNGDSTGEITLDWFGGEPLFHTAPIDTVCSAMKAAGRKYRSTMISNGYLFDEDMVQKAADLWNLQLVQIALDGTEETYNQRKAYIYRDVPSPFYRVLDNIERLLSAGVAVRIRLNLDDRNYNDLLKLCELLYARFNQHDRFSVYPVLLYQDVMLTGPNSSPEKLEMLYSYHEQLQYWLRDRGLFHLKSLPRALPVAQCMADSEQSIVIQPDGALLSCESYNLCETWGHIDHDERNTDVLAAWSEYMDELPECAACSLHPDCYRLRLCPNMPAFCHPRARENRERKTRWAMEDAWNRFKSDN